MECKNNAGEPRVAFSIDDDINITLYYKIKSPRKVAVQFTVFRSDYMMCYERRTDAEKGTVLLEGEGKIQLKLRKVQLLLGHYMIDFHSIRKRDILLIHLNVFVSLTYMLM